MNYGLKIKAGSIQNLTDARYFAAMGVDYLGIDLDSLAHPVAEFIDIAQWVEVPNLIAESKTMSESDWEDFIGFTKIEWIQQGSFLDHLSSENNYLVSQASFWLDVLSFSERQDSKSLIVDITRIDPQEMNKEVLKNFHAIQFCGSEEEKLGFKNYEELDSLFEWLEE